MTGCRAGAGCPFSHEIAVTTTGKDIQTSSHFKSGQSHLIANQDQQGAQGSLGTTQDVGTDVSGQETSSTGPSTTHKQSRPVSDSEKIDPRLFQLNQIRRRFNPDERDDGSATVLDIRLTPTDPDFPFEMTSLKCTLSVPHSYPGRSLPSLRVSNPEMDRGYQINVERGFDSLAASLPRRTLLALMNELDKRLESFLVAEKVQTIKLVANTGKSKTEPRSVGQSVGMPAHSTPAPFTPLQIEEAARKRELDVREMEAQMKHQPLFAVSDDGLSFMVPIEKSFSRPASLQHIDYINVFVPTLYNLEPCTVSFDDITSPDAVNVTAAFEQHVILHSANTLVAHVDYLVRNMHTLAEGPKSKGSVVTQTTTEDFDKPHIQYIAKPPEWDKQWEDDDEDSSDLYDSDDDSDEEEEDGGAALPSVPEAEVPADAGPDLGVRISFPSLELYGIELLQLVSVSLTVKCDRCKEEKDVKSVPSRSANDQSLVKHDSCNKCAGPFSIGELLSA